MNDHSTNSHDGGGQKPADPNNSRSGDAAHALPPAPASSSSEEGSHTGNKRPAYAGQWRTPPTAMFPSGGEQQTQQQQQQQHKQQPDAALSQQQQQQQQQPPPPGGSGSGAPQTLPHVSELPDSTEDYAKALQEAYRRGAEAAAAMANQPPQPLPPPPHPHGHPAAYPPPPPPHHHQHHHHQHPPQPYGPPPSSVSCPDFHSTHPAKRGSSGGDTAGTTVLPTPIMPPPPGAGMPLPNPLVPGPVSAAAAAACTMPPPPPQSRSGGVVKPLSSSIPPQLQQQAAPGASPSSSSANTAKQPPRSMSLPDMTSYAAQQEEEKRQKRLARNRASARLRRLRKKNLVDAYETEVGILEKTLEQLKVHEWGEQDHPRALAEALSMDRGQQVLTAEQRKQAATDILRQQLQYLDMLQDVMQEQYVLYQLVKSSRDGDAEKRDELEDLRQALQLTREQEDQLLEAGAGWEEEWQALQLVKASLQAMKDNDWLWNEGCNKVADDFMSLLHKNQISKFLLWADHNVEAIDQLDGVNAPANVPEGPVFHFGVNSNPEGILEEERV